MRPRSIVLFEQLFLASLVLSLVPLVLGYGAATAAWNNDPNVRLVGLGNGFLVGAMVVDYAVFLLLWFLVARKESNVAKWLLVAGIALSLVALPSILEGPWTVLTILSFAVYVLEIAALAFLFKADARAWLKGEGATDPAAAD
jgi:hypothetical protein